MVRTIREMLRLKGDRAVLDIRKAVLAHHRAIEIVSPIELHAGLGREHFHPSAAFRVIHLGRLAKSSGLSLVQDPVMVISPTSPELFVVSLKTEPMTVGVRKSKGVPSTGASSPVGISVSSTGVYRSA